MANTVNNRIVDLLKSQNVDESEVARLIGKDKSTLYRITSGQSTPTKTTVKLIAQALGADYQFLMFGKTQQNAKPQSTENSWKEEAYALMKEQLQKKDELIAQLMSVVQKLNFLNALDSAAVPYVFPGEKQGTVSRAAA